MADLDGTSVTDLSSSYTTVLLGDDELVSGRETIRFNQAQLGRLQLESLRFTSDEEGDRTKRLAPMVIQGVDGSAVQLDGMSLVLDASLLILDAEITEIDDVLINQQYADIASLDTRSVVLGGGVHASGDFDINAEWIGSVQAGMVHAGAMHTYVDAQDLDWVIGDKVETLTFHARFNAMMATDPSHGLSVELLNADGSFVFETDITSSLEGVDQQEQVSCGLLRLGISR